jgi:hypothetical protein
VIPLSGLSAAVAVVFLPLVAVVAFSANTAFHIPQAAPFLIYQTSLNLLVLAAVPESAVLVLAAVPGLPVVLNR